MHVSGPSALSPAESPLPPRALQPTLSITLPSLWRYLAVALPVLGGLLASMSTVDLAYHLRAGGELLDRGQITLLDSYTFTAAGEPWLNQQWLAQGVLAAVFRLGGWEGLHVLRAGLIGLTFALVLRAGLARGASSRQAALLTLAAFAVSVATLSLRPQLLALALFAFSLLLVADRRRRPGRLWLMPLVVAVWANVHGSFFLGPVLLGVAWLEDLYDRDRTAGRSFVVMLVAAAATLVNPFVFGVWGYALGLSTNPTVTNLISEWQPTSIRTFSGALFFASAFAVAVLLARRARMTPWPTLLWLGVLFAIGVYAVRGMAWWPLGAAVAVAGLLESPAVERVRREPSRRVNGVLAVVIALACVALLPWWRPVSTESAREGLLLHAPPALTTALREIAEPGDRIFNPQPWGSWLELSVPQAAVFVDSRIELFDPEVWQDQRAVASGHEDWATILDRRRVTIVVSDRDVLETVEARLASSPGWREAYADNDGAIFVRSDR